MLTIEYINKFIDYLRSMNIVIMNIVYPTFDKPLPSLSMTLYVRDSTSQISSKILLQTLSSINNVTMIKYRAMEHTVNTPIYEIEIELSPHIYDKDLDYIIGLIRLNKGR